MLYNFYLRQFDTKPIIKKKFRRAPGSPRDFVQRMNGWRMARRGALNSVLRKRGQFLNVKKYLYEGVLVAAV